jgi:hypothetical protein
VNRCGRQGRLGEPPDIGQPGGLPLPSDLRALHLELFTKPAKIFNNKAAVSNQLELFFHSLKAES